MTLGPFLLSTAGMLCVAGAAAILAGERERRLAAAGLLILGLGIAAWRAGSPPGIEPTLPESRGRGFVVGNGGLLLVGSGLVAGALLRAPRHHLRTSARLLGAFGIVLLGPVLISFIGAGGPLRALAAALGLWLAGAAVTAGMRGMASGAPARIAVRRLAPPPLPPPVQSARVSRPTVFIIVGLLATLIGPHVVAVFAGVVAASWAAWLASHPSGARPLPVAPMLTLLLVFSSWLLATIAGPVGLRIAALPQVPLSPAAELLLTPALLLAAWATAGLWPLQRQLPGALLAPAGAMLLARVAHPLVPGGLEYWRPLSVPLLVLGLWHAAACSRWPLVLAGAALLGIAGETSGPTAAGAALLVAALLFEVLPSVDSSPRVTVLLRVAAWPLSTWAGVGVLQEVLRGEVVYSTLAVIVLALIAAAGRGTAELRALPAR
jgi:hypothetical protein